MSKEARSYLIFLFCNILDRITSFVCVQEKFCNKKLIFGSIHLSIGKFPDLVMPA